MTDLGTASWMDRTETCGGIDEKTGHIIGQPCGRYHLEHTCLFDLTTKHRRCAAWPRCNLRLKRRPDRSIPGRVWVYYDLVVIRWKVE
jgi:hypothetical protein